MEPNAHVPEYDDFSPASGGRVNPPTTSAPVKKSGIYNRYLSDTDLVGAPRQSLFSALRNLTDWANTTGQHEEGVTHTVCYVCDARRALLTQPEPTQFGPPYSTITLSICPTVWDPTDQGPIFIRPERVMLAARTLLSRLAVWYIRRYVLAICRGEK